MHDTAMENGARFFGTYLSQVKTATILDIGAQDVNGSLRTVCPSRFPYVGVDFARANGVDVVLDDPYKLPFETACVDAVVSTSCFEHSEMFWVLYLEIVRVLRPDGLFYLNAPSNGPYHRYPVDCWRFYPDCGTALVRWGRTQGIRSAVLESFVSEPSLDPLQPFQDFVSVFVKDETLACQHPRRILDTYTQFKNGFVRAEDGNLYPRNATWPPIQKSLDSELPESRA
jgi:SAM-dependent methyltransferase